MRNAGQLWYGTNLSAAISPRRPIIELRVPLLSCPPGLWTLNLENKPTVDMSN